MRKLRFRLIIGLTLSIVGTLLLLNTQSNLTGAVVGSSKAIFSLNLTLGVAFAAAGLLLLLSTRKELRKSKLEEQLAETSTIRDKVKRVENAYMNGLLNYIEAAEKIDEYVDLRGMIYKHERQFTIEGPNVRYSLKSVTGVDLAYAIRDRIIAKDPEYEKKVQLHISKTESTKHHKKGLGSK